MKTSKRILVVDDDVDIVRIVSKMLSQQDYDVDTACGGEEALNKVKSNRPDVVECHTVSFTPVMQLVAGPGVLGVAFYPQP